MSEKNKVVIIDFGMGNLFSIKQACLCADLNPEITSDPDVISKANGLILPGVGAFGDAINTLKKLDLIVPITNYVKSGRPFMGICLGMQLLLTESLEFGRFGGLDLISGTVERIPDMEENGKKVKIPAVGWNKVFSSEEDSAKWKSSPLCNVTNGEYMYFVHSYYVNPSDKSCVLSFTDYAGFKYASSIISKNVFACQYHPERSGKEGLKIYLEWAKKIKTEN